MHVYISWKSPLLAPILTKNKSVSVTAMHSGFVVYNTVLPTKDETFQLQGILNVRTKTE